MSVFEKIQPKSNNQLILLARAQRVIDSKLCKFCDKHLHPFDANQDIIARRLTPDTEVIEDIKIALSDKIYIPPPIVKIIMDYAAEPVDINRMIIFCKPEHLTAYCLFNWAMPYMKEPVDCKICPEYYDMDHLDQGWRDNGVRMKHNNVYFERNTALLEAMEIMQDRKCAHAKHFAAEILNSAFGEDPAKPSFKQIIRESRQYNCKFVKTGERSSKKAKKYLKRKEK